MGHQGRQTGFTLIEMIVVIVVMAMIAGLVLMKQPWHSAGLNTDATLKALQNTLRLARSRAIAQDRSIIVVTGPGGFSIDGGLAWIVPRDLALSPAQVVFNPDGGSSGGTILLTAGNRRIETNINWLTGRVKSHERD